jgi:hypothetical protein
MRSYGFIVALGALLGFSMLASVPAQAQFATGGTAKPAQDAAKPPLVAAKPPRDLAKRVARNESLVRELRDQYAFRQSFLFEEYASNGRRMGMYQELREVQFASAGTREEVLVGSPSNSLQRIRLTDEDFHDVREIQNFLFTEDVLWLYQVRLQGEEAVNGEPCWVMRVSPRNQLEDMRFFEGVLWVSKRDEEIVQASGRAVPEIRTAKNENLFPVFTTVREKIDGHWMPVLTFADDDLAFSSGRQRVRLQVEFQDYKRFGAESSIAFSGPTEEDAITDKASASPNP